MNQRGFSATVLIIVVAVATAALGGFYFLSSSGKAPGLPGLSGITSSLKPKATEKDFSFIEDEKVKKHYVAQANVEAYRQKSPDPVSSGYKISEQQTKGADFNSRTQDFDKNNEELAHLIILSDTTFVKDYSDGKWWKQIAKETSGEETKPEEEKNVIEEYSDFKQPEVSHKFLGMEKCGNLNCYKYEETYPEMGNAARVFWFDDGKFLLRKEEISSGGVKITNEYSYDNINITAPSPTKDVPEGKDIYEYYRPAASQQPSETEMKRLQEEFFNSPPPSDSAPTDYYEPPSSPDYEE